MSLYLAEQGIEHRRISADTGWEHASTYEHLSYLGEKLGPIEIIRPKLSFVELVRSKQLFPSRIMRFCTSELKIIPINRYLASLGDGVVNAIGIRAAESAARANLPEREVNESTGFEIWRPILRWTTQDVVDIHRRHGIKMHPLYRYGAKRVGCWPCIYASKAELRIIARIDPGRIDLIERLEADLTTGKHGARSMFWLERPIKKGLPRKLDPAPIRDVIRWAQQERGNELLGFGEPDWACASMGYCDVGR
jgi:3'-phosphoadenosine 5'-phosphosulfate sulfotransferase (PAPS reductase)/FAD synthetase